MIRLTDFVDIFGNEKTKKLIRYGVITNAAGKRVKLDGESSASIKRYPHLSSYTPVVGDKVVIISGVIYGKIVR